MTALPKKPVLYIPIPVETARQVACNTQLTDPDCKTGLAAEAARLQALIGEMVEGEGVYLGRYAPCDRSSNSLGRIFNVYAAPEDLSAQTMTYEETLKAIGDLKAWHGHDGEAFADDEELYQAIKAERYKGGWIVPTRGILRGHDNDGDLTTPDNLFVHRNKGALRNTFKADTADGRDYPSWYWSCVVLRKDPSLARDVCMVSGDNGLSHVASSRLSCRPVRLVPA